MERPWLEQYAEGIGPDLAPEYLDALSMFRASLARSPESPLIHYFDATLTIAEVDTFSDALAMGLRSLGVRSGDRVAVYMQNVPQFILTVLAAWKLGAIPVLINPMNKHREVELLLADSGAKVLLCLESLYYDVAQDVIPDSSVEIVVTTSDRDFLGNWVPSLFQDQRDSPSASTYDFMTLVADHQGQRPPSLSLGPDSIAFLTYTSGTTGPPKGAMNTHENVVFTAQAYRDWVGIGSNDAIFGIAPLFHITGLVGHIALALLVPCPLILGYRFESSTYLDLIDMWKPTFTIGAITALMALMEECVSKQREMGSIKKIYSGGQPIPAAIVEEFERHIGPYIHGAYGLTETTSPSHLVPFGRRAPVDPLSGALAAGVPIFNTYADIVDEAGNQVPVGEMGEIRISGPQVVPGYWNKKEETTRTFPEGRLLTGDIGLVDEDGWFFVVDRKKDQINASGYKVWPREVEDVLYEHPAVREAAVVGIPDSYRGETVKAIVSLKAQCQATPEELIAFCKERLAAYKYPRSVEIIKELPKTASGKILRRDLRQ